MSLVLQELSKAPKKDTHTIYQAVSSPRVLSIFVAFFCGCLYNPQDVC